MNLVKNALKFTKKGSIVIQVSYRDEPEHLLIVHVKDSGSGIAKEDFPKLFTRFGKLHRTAKQNSEGVGLGLNMVKQIVEQSGGEVAVESDGIGHGSCFCISMNMKSFYANIDDVTHDTIGNPLSLLVEE